MGVSQFDSESVGIYTIKPSEELPAKLPWAGTKHGGKNDFVQVNPRAIRWC
jgi:hypothetical protein